MEVILNLKSEIDNENFITDSNGLFEIKWVFTNKFEQSIYPMSLFSWIEDTKTDSILEVFNDWA